MLPRWNAKQMSLVERITKEVIAGKPRVSRVTPPQRGRKLEISQPQQVQPVVVSTSAKPPQKPSWYRAQRNNTCIASVVYFVQRTTGGSIKIGYTRNLKRRLMGLVVGSDAPLVVLATIPTDNHRIEIEIHRRFAKYRLHGEWFSPSEELLVFIASI
jgi:Meiotically Up-regulated Gene 113 (MUG113) protein